MFRLLAALAALGFLVWTATLPVTHRLDETITVWLQGAAPGPDYPASVLVFLGNAEVVIPAVVLAAGLLWARHRDAGLGILWFAAGLTVASLLAVTMKHLIIHPGPVQYGRAVIHIGLLHTDTPYSFPSGHTLRTTLLAWTGLRNAPRLAGLLILSMMAALVYLGDHWLSDVLGGLCLGWVLIEAAGVVTTARSRNYRRG